MEGIVKAGILKAFSGKVNLIRREDLPDEWDPTTDNILCVWEATQYLIKRLEMEGEYSASSLLKLSTKRFTFFTTSDSKVSA